MNKAEKETVGRQLKDEEQCLKDLEKAYKQARKDCQQKLKELNSRSDMQNLQSIIYQKKYQQALLKQIDGVLNDLQTHTYKTANDFFQGSYVNGYVGSMYELMNQGIPLTIPVNPKKMVRAIQTDSKLSTGYYLKQGLTVQNIRTLKKQVALEATRGIANGKSWLEVADSLSVQRYFQISQSDAMRIVRTEGNRINQQARLDAGDEAVDAGCDLMKQWDATLDGRTRLAHREADGQIVEWKDKFLVMGEHLEAPSIGGSASNVINCRCQLLKRPRWSLDEEELETLKKRAEFYGLDKSKSFEDYRKKFLKATEEQKANPTKVFEPLQANDETKLREHIGQVKEEYKKKNETLTTKEADLKKIKDAEKYWEDYVSWKSNPEEYIEDRIEFFSKHGGLWKEDLEQLKFIKSHLDVFKRGDTKSLKDPINKDLRSIRKELKRLQEIMDADYDELEKILGKINIGDNLLAEYGEDHCKRLRGFLLDASEEDRRLWDACSDQFHVLQQTTRGRKRKGAYYSSYEDGVWLNIKSASVGSDYQPPYQVVFHEYGHHADYILNRKYGNGDRHKGFSETYKGGIFEITIKEEAEKAIEEFAKANGYVSLPNKGTVMQKADAMVRRGLLLPSEKMNWVKKQLSTVTIDRIGAEKAFCEHMKKTISLPDRSDISDMFEPSMTTTDYPFGIGHGRGYWSTGKNAKEAFAEIYSARVNNQGSYEQIKKYFPKSVEIFEEMLKVIK